MWSGPSSNWCRESSPVRWPQMFRYCRYCFFGRTFSCYRSTQATNRGLHRLVSDEEHERWNRRYRERGTRDVEPSPHLLTYADILPRTGRVLDVAGGDGGNAIWLAQRGLQVTIVDISEAGLALAATHAQRAGVEVKTVVADLDREPLPDGPWAVIIDFYFLARSLIPRMVAGLAPDGVLLWVHPTRSNRLRHPRPGARFLLDDGEASRLIADLASDDFRIIEIREGWQTNGRHESIVVLQRSNIVAPIPDD